MPPRRRRLPAAAFMLYGLAAAGTAALAQDNPDPASNTIGPPQLKDFSLPGQRTTPPVATPEPPAAAPPPAATPPRPAPETAPPVARDRPGPAARPADSGRDAAPAPSPAPDPAAELPSASTAPPVATEAPAQPLPSPPAADPAPVAAEPEGPSWLWLALGGAILILAGALVLLRRRRSGAEREQARDSARDELGGALFAAPEREPEPEPRPAAVPAPEAPAAPRPWLELDIVPERAAATDSEAVVHYALTITNQGNSDARNIRIDPRLFNAGDEADMTAFLQGPIHEQSGSPHVVLSPGGSLKLNGQVAMPKTELQEIEMAGRRIYVPMIAINVAYDWIGGTGRTSRSWLVGREAETPSAKMGPFRLDLGPRIYRSVGRREAKLVRV